MAAQSQPRVAVLGMTESGRGWATLVSTAGWPVTIYDHDTALLQGGEEEIASRRRHSAGSGIALVRSDREPGPLAPRLGRSLLDAVTNADWIIDATASDLLHRQRLLEQVERAVPSKWRLDVFRERVPGPHFAEVEPGAVYEVEGRDTVTAAPELARLTLNVARAHTDAGATTHGKRLVYGGHTIGIAAAQATRALPNLVTILAWRSCDHLGPVFEEDALGTELTVEGVRALRDGGLVELRARTSADRGEVLDWRFVGLMA